MIRLAPVVRVEFGRLLLRTEEEQHIIDHVDVRPLELAPAIHHCLAEAEILEALWHLLFVVVIRDALPK
eukprot:6677773-Prymnesium_polylepis.1